MNFVWSGCSEVVPDSKVCTDLMDFLLSRGMDINAKSQDKFEITPLHYSIVNCAPKGVEYLIQKGADINVPATGEKFKGLKPLPFLIHIDLLNQQCKSNGRCAADSGCSQEKQNEMKKLLIEAGAL